MSNNPVLNPTQRAELGARLHDTTRNIFREAEQLLGRHLESNERDLVFKEVCEGEAMFKCDECSRWLNNDEGVRGLSHICAECYEDEDRE